MTKTNIEAKRTAEFEGAQTLAYVQMLTDGPWGKAERLSASSLVLADAQLKCRATAAFRAAQRAL